MGYASWAAFARAIKDNTSLQSISLEAFGTQVRSETWAAFARAIEANTSLQFLAIATPCNVFMNDQGMVAIAHAIKSNNTLKSFHMNAHDTDIGDASSVALADSIKEHSTLRSFQLDAGHTQIGDASWAAFAHASTEKTSLRSFAIAAFGIQMSNEQYATLAPGHSEAFASPTESNMSLTSFSLDAISTREMFITWATREQARANTSLTFFKFETPLRRDHMLRLAMRNAICVNTTLTSITIVPTSDLHVLAECMARDRLLIADAQAFRQVASIANGDAFCSLRERTFRMKVMECFLPAAAAARDCLSIPMEQQTGHHF